MELLTSKRKVIIAKYITSIANLVLDMKKVFPAVRFKPTIRVQRIFASVPVFVTEKKQAIRRQIRLIWDFWRIGGVTMDHIVTVAFVAGNTTQNLILNTAAGPLDTVAWKQTVEKDFCPMGAVESLLHQFLLRLNARPNVDIMNFCMDMALYPNGIA